MAVGLAGDAGSQLSTGLPVAAHLFGRWQVCRSRSTPFSPGGLSEQAVGVLIKQSLQRAVLLPQHQQAK